MVLPVGSSRHRRAQADLLLLLVALIWGTAFVAQRVAALNMGAFQFNGVRFLLGALVLVPFAWYRRGLAEDQKGKARLGRNDLLGIALAGLLLFGGASLQQIGLRFTTASNAGFITGLYVVFIPILLWVRWRHPQRRTIWVASLLAAAGLYLLSTGGSFRLAPGDALELSCAVLWAFHVIWLGRLVRTLDALDITIGQDLVCGALSLAWSAVSERGALPLSGAAGWAILYTGVISVGFGYTLQAVGQRLAPPADAGILLSLEAVFAALSGWLLLDERLSTIQLMGCGLILAAMLLAQVRETKT